MYTELLHVNYSVGLQRVWWFHYPSWILQTELEFTCLSGLHCLACLYTPGFVPSLLSCLGVLVVRAPCSHVIMGSNPAQGSSAFLRKRLTVLSDSICLALLESLHVHVHVYCVHLYACISIDLECVMNAIPISLFVPSLNSSLLLFSLQTCFVKETSYWR